MAPLLPQGYTAVVQSAGDLGVLGPSIITSDFAQVLLSDYQKHTPMTTGITECKGNCSAIVQAAEINVECGALVPTHGFQTRYCTMTPRCLPLALNGR